MMPRCDLREGIRHPVDKAPKSVVNLAVDRLPPETFGGWMLWLRLVSPRTASCTRRRLAAERLPVSMVLVFVERAMLWVVDSVGDESKFVATRVDLAYAASKMTARRGHRIPTRLRLISRGGARQPLADEETGRTARTRKGARRGPGSFYVRSGCGEAAQDLIPSVRSSGRTRRDDDRDRRSRTIELGQGVTDVNALRAAH
jgi:hypothetical protein